MAVRRSMPDPDSPRIPPIPADRPWPHYPNPDGAPVPTDWKYVAPRDCDPDPESEPGQ